MIKLDAEVNKTETENIKVCVDIYWEK